MREAARRLDFEQAAELRDRLRALKKTADCLTGHGRPGYRPPVPARNERGR